MSGSRVLLVVSLAASLLMIGVGLIVALLPQRVMDLSGSLQSVGHTASVFALSYLLIQVPLGHLADRIGAKPFLVLGYGLCGISGLVFFFAGSVETVLLGRFIQGAGEAPVWALGPALLSIAYPRAKGRAIGIYNAAIHAGLTAGPLLGLLFFPGAKSSAPFLVFAVLCGCGAVVIVVFLRQGDPVPERLVAHAPRPADLVGLLKSAGPLVTLCGVLLYGAGYGVFVSVLPAFLSISKGFGAQAVGVLFALFYVAISISQLVVGPLSARPGRRGSMVAGVTLSAIGFVSFAAFPGLWVLAPLTLASLGLGVFCISSLAFLNECVQENLRSTVSGGYYLAWGLGYFLGPLVVGWLGETTHPNSGFVLLALLFATQAIAQRLSATRSSRAGD